MASTVGPMQDEAFFLQQGTLDSLNAVTGSEKLVIYCGAGVTIDQTGVSWSQLVQQVFGVGHGAQNEDSAKFKSVQYLLSVMDDPRQLASIVAEVFRSDRVRENDFLKTALMQILYRKETWSTGQILRNVARFAIMATMFGRDVTIITTNYDAYIEEEIDIRFTALVKEGEFPEDLLPGLYRTLHEPGKEPVRIDIRGAEGGGGEIELIYLHGRIDNHGSTEGVIVLTEDSYARTREMSRTVLESHFRRAEDGTAKAVLIVGASLTDGPLIDALALTHEREAPRGTEPQVRLALTDLPLSAKDLKAQFDSTMKSKIDTGDVRNALALRGKHLGVDILWPASHSQTAQFLEEMRVDLNGRMRHGREDAYTAEGVGIAYAARLKLWEIQFQASRTMTDQAFVHNRLSVTAEAIRVALKHHKYNPKAETLRLELWARIKPSTRKIDLIGNSTGPLIDRSALRHEGVDRADNASVAAFLEGRPLLRAIEDLDPDLTSNRWKTFLAVPIFVHAESAAGNGGGRLPVGVITLASTLSIRHKDSSPWSVFRDLDSTVIERIKSTLMIPIGHSLLSPERSGEQWAAYDRARLPDVEAELEAIRERENALSSGG